MQNAPCVLSVRNSSVIQYYDVSCLDINRNGCKASLNQNNNSVYKDAMLDLNDTEVIPQEYEDINHFYSEYEALYNKHKEKSLAQKLFLRPIGTLSANQNRTCKKAVENMVNTVLLNFDKRVNYKDQSYVAFVTLTLPIKQNHTDKVFRKMLVRFIENLTKTYKVKHYIWKAEPQKNGNIHFHLLIDRWIPKEAIQSLWNRQLNTYDYIDNYKRIRTLKGLSANEPPTTKIHSLEKVSNTVSYIMKYMTKQEHEKRQIIGKIWGCANITKRLEYPKFYDSETFFDQVQTLISSKALKHLVKDEFINVYFGKVFKHVAKSYKKTWNAIKKHYNLMNAITVEKLEEIDNFVSVKESVERFDDATEFLQKLASDKAAKYLEIRIQNNKNALLKFKEKCISELHLYNPLQIKLL
jgi:hypothetical protein